MGFGSLPPPRLRLANCALQQKVLIKQMPIENQIDQR
jgi:hypothetical protein